MSEQKQTGFLGLTFKKLVTAMQFIASQSNQFYIGCSLYLAIAVQTVHYLYYLVHYRLG